MAFTDAELAVLSQLAYQDVSENESGFDVPLLSFLEEHEDSLKKSLGSSYEPIIDGLVEKAQNQGYVIVKAENDKDGTGFAAMAIRDPNNEVTVACRGTEGFSFDYDSRKDILTDAQIGALIETNQQEKMEEFMSDLEEEGYDGYYFTGHSLGGNDAAHGAVTLKDSSKVKRVVTFNSPGFNDGYMADHSFDIEKIEDRVINYQNEYDYVSSLFPPIGSKYVVESSKDDQLFSHIGFSDHSICNFKLNATYGFQKKNQNKSLQTIVPNVLSDGINAIWSMHVVGNFVLSKIYGEGESKKRDFSEDAFNMFAEAAKETEEEAWWDITHWDCWYRIDRFFGSWVADWQRCSGDVDSYYRKIIDMNDAAVKDIRNIFDSVHNIDNEYSARVARKTDLLSHDVLAKLMEISGAIVVGG